MRGYTLFEKIQSGGQIGLFIFILFLADGVLKHETRDVVALDVADYFNHERPSTAKDNGISLFDWFSGGCLRHSREAGLPI